MVQSEIIVRILIFGTLGMAILAGAVILFVINYQKKLLQQKNDLQELEIQFQKALFQSTLRSQESERQRIAQDLHDDLAGDLSALKLMLNRIPKYLKNEEMLGEITHSSKEMVIQAIDKVQHIARDQVSLAWAA
ncbi:MAG: histidine kinase dimerization/phosphoacceptor domain-containing protein, partial [Bacteroidota bacterium]